MKTVACRPSWKVSRKISTASSASRRSRLARLARTVPASAWARMPKWMAEGEYHTSTSVAFSAGRPSTGAYWENPTRRAARSQAASLRIPSTFTCSSIRGISTRTWLSRPLYEGGASAAAGATRLRRRGRIMGEGDSVR